MSRNAEAQIQRSILEYLWLVAPQLMVFHVPNGGLRERREAARLKWQGVLAGVPDLVLTEPGGRVFYIEVKAPGKVLQPDQESFRDWCLTHAVPWMTARSINDIRAALIQWRIPSKDAEAA